MFKNMSHSGYGGRNRGDGYRRNNNGRKQFQRLGGTDIVEPNAIVRGPSGLSLSLSRGRYSAFKRDIPNTPSTKPSQEFGPPTALGHVQPTANVTNSFHPPSPAKNHSAMTNGNGTAVKNNDFDLLGVKGPDDWNAAEKHPILHKQPRATPIHNEEPHTMVASTSASDNEKCSSCAIMEKELQSLAEFMKVLSKSFLDIAEKFEKPIMDNGEE